MPGAALLAGCSGSNDAASNAADNGAAANPDATTLIVGLDNAYPPYGFIGDDGNLTGFDIDLATEVARAMVGISSLKPSTGMLRTRC